MSIMSTMPVTSHATAISKPPLLSIVFVSYRSQRDLERCLPSLAAQCFQDFEIIVVDNGPDDGTDRWLKTCYPTVLVVSNPTNSGYAGGNNLGVAHAGGRYVLILNPDTELLPGALQLLIEAVQARPDALINAKLLHPDGSVNACGLEMHYTGVSTCRGLGAAAEHYRGLHTVPLLSGAALIASRKTFLTLEGFDANYFMYLEDVEFSLRARLAGYELFCAADAGIVHHYAPRLSAQKFFYLERNRLLTLLKVYERRTLWRMLPALLLTELATWGYALLKGRAYLGARMHVYLWLWRARREWRTARTELQAKRRVSDELLLQGCLWALPLEQLLKNPALTWVLHQLTAPLYRLNRPRFENSQKARPA